jgi:hypothetical protein
MASEIKRSPILKGDDAVRFLKEVSEPRPIAQDKDLKRKVDNVREIWREFREGK